MRRLHATALRRLGLLDSSPVTTLDGASMTVRISARFRRSCSVWQHRLKRFTPSKAAEIPHHRLPHARLERRSRQASIRTSLRCQLQAAQDSRVARDPREGNDHGIDRCVLVQTIYHGWDNGYLVHCLKAEPQRFKGQGLIDPTDPKVAEKLEYWMTKHGLAGMLQPHVLPGRDEWLNARATDAVWQKGAELGAVFNFFIAASQLPKLEDMVKRHPRVKVVIDHVGRVDLEAKDPEPEIRNLLALGALSERVGEGLRIQQPVAVEEVSVPRRLSGGQAASTMPSAPIGCCGAPASRRRGQADRPTVQEELAIIQKEIPFFTAEDREKILGKNAAKLWGFQ